MRLTLSLALVVSLTLNALLWRQEVKCPVVETHYYAYECSHVREGTAWVMHCARSGRY